MVNKKNILVTIFFLALLIITPNIYSQENVFSTAGFYKSDLKSDRSILNFNSSWNFYKGTLPHLKSLQFKNLKWQKVNLPHGIEILPEEASGGKNYQGVVWYKKDFLMPTISKEKTFSIYFEAIMGKCKIWINGNIVKEHKGGYLPVIINSVETYLYPNKPNTILVMADNSNDTTYLPGKSQYTLDFCYFGGIYRDAYFIITNKTHITDANVANKKSGGGVFFYTENATNKNATVSIETHIINENTENKNVKLLSVLKDNKGNIIAEKKENLFINKGENKTIIQKIDIDNPYLWTLKSPYLYQLHSIIYDDKGVVIDAYYNKVGIRNIELKNKQGLFFNGEAYTEKLIGVNRHQDYAYIGNAVPNNLQWRDVKKLKDAGINIIRSAHYPQDPSFMDACDSLGVLVIVATPGWQYWNPEPYFETLIIDDIQQMIRRDRNHASIFAWEPILNETHYPSVFAKRAYETTHQEFDNKNTIAACDINTANYEMYDLIYSHPNEKNEKITNKCIFTREFGDNVDDWNTHNSNSRASLAWGEIPQLIQATHYSKPAYPFTSLETLQRTSKQHIGGALWHSFDHQRGYHPDPFYGGILDAFRYPKYSYYMFKSLQNVGDTGDSSAYLYVANEMTPFSPEDITVYTNCDSVRLIIFAKDTLVQAPIRSEGGLQHPPIVFKNAFKFIDMKMLVRKEEDLYIVNNQQKRKKIQIIAEAFMGGKVVKRVIKRPAVRPTKIKLEADILNEQIIANGATIIPVFASIVDDEGNIKRLNNEYIKFSVEGEGEIIGDEKTMANPKRILWGVAPALIKTKTTAGKIKINARLAFEGNTTPMAAELVLNSYEDKNQYIKNIDAPNDLISEWKNIEKDFYTHSIESTESIKHKLKKVEKDQTEFEDKTIKHKH